MGSAASTVGSPSSSNANVNVNGQLSSPPVAIDMLRRKSSISGIPCPSKKQSNGFLVFSYEPTYVPLANKRGVIRKGFPEHGMIQDRYFLIKDHFRGIDRLKTLKDYGAPNFRKARGRYSVYGMGQPSRDGLAKVIQVLLESEHKVSNLGRSSTNSASEHVKI